MTINFISLIFICMLPLKASSQNDSITMTTGETTRGFTHDQVTMMSNSTPSTMPDVNLTSTTPSLPATQTMPSKTLSPDIHPTATSAYSMLSQSSSTTSATMVVSNQATNETTPTPAPPMLSSSTQSQEAGKMSTSLFTSDKTTHSSTSLTQSTDNISTPTSSNKPVSTNTLPVSSSDATQSTGLYKTSKTTTKTPFIHTTKEKEKQDKGKQGRKGANKGTNPGTVVAGLIGGALVLMMVGFLFIFIKKRKLQRQQITTSDWAGPSPFLQGGTDNGQITLRSSNRVSFSSFLPQRLSKRLSLLPETDEELEEIRPGTTFGSKHERSSFGQKVDENDVKESNGTAALGPEMKSTGDATETVENSVSVTSSQTNDALSTNENSKTANLSDPPTPSETVENATAKKDDGLGQL
ncbi:flocculation protein FLO11 [Thunnus albacares]|uniref:flocculation protein FLO11 n=1 Tax=Thunnus albacares TaxID=8236 RepID=UPI001CF681A2|nr:flocculation protein FLO11 [Thunnus albacares]